MKLTCLVATSQLQAACRWDAAFADVAYALAVVEAAPGYSIIGAKLRVAILLLPPRVCDTVVALVVSVDT